MYSQNNTNIWWIDNPWNNNANRGIMNFDDMDDFNNVSSLEDEWDDLENERIWWK